mgnify:FL=1|jgi:uncharacterized protein (TIGR00645 family)|tara:strand:+ start:322 stop:837 length:516 start_codon:yes stop_codon:yes gene_type:complete
MRDFLEDFLERLIFASRWLLAPIYIVLCLSLLFITVKVIQETVNYFPVMLVQDVKGIMLFVLHIVDLVLVGNLVLMIIFAGYENFVSKIHIAEESEDRPTWMGTVDFSELKLKLVASIVTISGINLLAAFMDLSQISDREIFWMVVVHVVFILSGVLLALMDFVTSKSKSI